MNGLIDLHSHLLPGIDDGCVHLDETLGCIRRLKERGFVGSVCTPHVWPDQYPHITRDFIRDRVVTLRSQLQEAGIDYQLWPGGEVRIAESTIDWLDQHGVTTLGASRFVLVDYWGNFWPSFADEVIEFLFEREYRPLLAHPERMDFSDHELRDVLDCLLEKGVLLQGNLRCIKGAEGRRVQSRALELLDNGKYYVLATDTHGPADLQDRLEGIEEVAQRRTTEVAAQLLNQHPAEILAK